MSYFEAHYKENLTKDEAILLGVKALHQATEEKLNPEATEIGLVDRDFSFYILPQDESKAYVEKAIGGN